MIFSDIAESLQFLPNAPDRSILFAGDYDPFWVAVSILLAVFSSFATLHVAEQIGQTPRRAPRMAWLAGGALSMGCGIWAMHFVGLLAFDLPCAVAFDAPLTLASIVPGMLASAAALWTVSLPRRDTRTLLLGGLLFGAGIGGMHYSGMAAMRLDGLVRYDPTVFSVSWIVAVILATLALWTNRELRTRGAGQYASLAGGLVLGGAVAAMHYTAMAATYFINDGVPRHLGETYSTAGMAVLVSVLSLMLIGTTFSAALVGHGRKVAARLRESERRVRRIIESTQEGFVMVDADHRITEVNDAMCAMLETTRDALVGRSVFEFVDAANRRTLDEQIGKRQAGERRSYEIELTLPNGGSKACLVNSAPMRDARGAVFGSFALISDLSHRREHEAYMRQAVAVFENTAEGIMVTGRDGRIQRVNPAFTEITGYSEAEVIGESPRMLRSGRHDAGFYRRLWAEVTGHGHWQGEIWNRRKTGEVYPEWLTISAVRDASGTVQNYVGVFSDISHIKRSEAELERLAHYDPLTALPNRTFLNMQLELALERASRNKRGLAVMELDLDGFKTVNDSLGHPAGDLLLQIIGQRLVRVLRGEDVIARMGGDEFAIIIENPPAAPQLGHIAEKIIQGVAEPVDLDGHSALVTASIGIALYPDDGEDATGLLKAADTAMYAGKQGGRNTYRFHDGGMAEAASKRLRLEHGLRQALESGQLDIWYQPRIDFVSGDVVAVEALLRWLDPQVGIVPPAEFIPVAEETGLILPMGEWVLLQACMQARAWAGSGLFHGVMSVNVSGTQIERGDFVSTVRQALDNTGIDPAMLELEITESFLMRNAEQAMAVVGKLSDLGIGVAIDDFGTGFSSLSYLKYLRADRLKIDRRFIRDLPDDKDDAAIVRAVMALGLSLGFQVVAEGVEAVAQEAFLSAGGCHQGQGFLYAPPLPVDEFERWLRQRRCPAAAVA